MPDSKHEQAKAMLKAKSGLFLFMGFILLWMITNFSEDKDPIQIYMIYFMIGLCFFGAIVGYISAMRADDVKKLDMSKPVYTCKHCGEKYNSEKNKDRHEKSCPKMKI